MFGLRGRRDDWTLLVPRVDQLENGLGTLQPRVGGLEYRTDSFHKRLLDLEAFVQRRRGVDSPQEMGPSPGPAPPPGIQSLTADLASGAPLFTEEGNPDASNPFSMAPLPLAQLAPGQDPATSLSRLNALQQQVENQHGSGAKLRG